MLTLSEFVSVKPRYARSANLERDFGLPDSVAGYIPSSRAFETIQRFFRSFDVLNSVRAWTLIGSYGTGKSSFANFLTALCAPRNDASHQIAIDILKQTDKFNSLQGEIDSRIPESGLIRAVATAQREPVTRTVIRALHRGASVFWQNSGGRRLGAIEELDTLRLKSQQGAAIDNNHLVQVILSLAHESKAGILLIVDELGKNLEFSAQNQLKDDIYLLQQITELPLNSHGFNVFILGLMHQSFIDYSHGLAVAQRNEWAKIQGRFEDIPFIESPRGTTLLIGKAIDQSSDNFFKSRIDRWASKWQTALSDHELSNHFSKADLVSIYPLHPLSAVLLPILCAKYSQNDRTLFTFLASNEPDSFSTFLNQEVLGDKHLPNFKLHKVYDYFVESAGMSIAARPQFQRWVEIQSCLSDAKNLDPDVLLVLKTIGLLNLVSTSGFLRASRKTVCLAMSDDPHDEKELQHWNSKIDELLVKGFLIWRKRIDELRIWQGSDFDIEKELSEHSEMLNVPLADLLNEYSPLRPVVIQRHSYETGTLRYFERQFCHTIESLEYLERRTSENDGLICYWIGDKNELKNLAKTARKTSDGKPVLIICGSELNALKLACHEYVSLLHIRKNAKQLQTDGVARREVSLRILYSQRLLDDALSRSFALGDGTINLYEPNDKITAFNSWSTFQNFLSRLCDSIYNATPRIWNELINRRELTPQGASARNKLIASMLENAGQPKLGIKGNGPEYSMFESVLKQTGLYTESKDGWIFSKPQINSNGIYEVWTATELFCKEARTEPINISHLYTLLEAPPYGVKRGIVPVLLLAVLLHHNEDVSVYIDGSFVPILGPEHFELLTKRPERFSVKFFEISGIRSAIFDELSKILSSEGLNTDVKFRNRTILSIVKPLVGFVKKLPQFTCSTENGLTQEAKSVRKALLDAKEPDELLFKELPKACGLPVITGNADDDHTIAKSIKQTLVRALNSLQVAYDVLLGQCENLIRRAFAINIDTTEFRDNLRYRAMNLSSQVIELRLKSFILASSDGRLNNRSWIESLLMIISGKPPKSWTDEDVIIFETKLSDIARRFMNLEALQKQIAIPGEGIDARRITVTYPDGYEIHQVLWIERDRQPNIEKIADQVIEKYNLNDPNLKQALAAAFIEKTFQRKSEIDKSTIRELTKEQEVG